MLWWSVGWDVIWCVVFTSSGNYVVCRLKGFKAANDFHCFSFSVSNKYIYHYDDEWIRVTSNYVHGYDLYENGYEKIFSYLFYDLVSLLVPIYSLIYNSDKVCDFHLHFIFSFSYKRTLCRYTVVRDYSKLKPLIASQLSISFSQNKT